MTIAVRTRTQTEIARDLRAAMSAVFVCAINYVRALEVLETSEADEAESRATCAHTCFGQLLECFLAAQQFAAALGSAVEIGDRVALSAALDETTLHRFCAAAPRGAREGLGLIELGLEAADSLIGTLQLGAQDDLRRQAAPTPVAVRLARNVVRILPATNRRRYYDEFASELFELAAAGASRRAQLAYALRLLDRAWVLRAELQNAAAKRARS